MKFFMHHSLMNTPRCFVWISKILSGSILGALPHPIDIFDLSKNFDMIVNSGIRIAWMFLKTIQVDYPIIKKGLAL